MRRTLSDIYWVCWREMKRFWLQKSRIATSVIQPVVWLVLMGNNLSGLTRNPAAAGVLGTSNYLEFMTPGVIVMTALFSGVYGGTTVLWDRRLGFLNKMLAAPIRRAAIPLGKLLSLMLQSWLQMIVIVIVAAVMGVRFATGVPGIIAMLLLASLFGLIMGSVSLALSARLKSIETLFAIMNFLTLPLMFTSNAIFPRQAMPGWLQSIAAVNPLTFAVTPMRTLATQGWLWGALWWDVLILLLLALLAMTLAVREFGRAIG